MIGSGTGLIYILRWFWWRINAYTEIVAMISSVVVAAYFNFGNSNLEGWEKIVLGSLITTIVWVVATYFTPPDDDKTLRKFVEKVNPGGPGWIKYSTETISQSWPVPRGILCMGLGCIAIYGILLGIGQLIYGQSMGYPMIGISFISAFGLYRTWK